MTNFEICQLLETPGPFEYLEQKPRGSENQSFLDAGATRLGVSGGQVPRLYGGTILGGGVTHLGHPEHKSSIFRWFKFTLKPPYTIASGNLLSAIWTLPIGLLLSNLDSRQLETSPMASYDQF